MRRYGFELRGVSLFCTLLTSGWWGGLLLLGAVPCIAQGQRSAHEQAAAVEAPRLYAGACGPCHGLDGDGKGTAAELLGSPRPRDFTVGTFKFRSTPTGSLPTDADIYRTISRGVPGTWMVAWEELLTPAQRWALVRYIKGFSERFAEEEPLPPLEIPPGPEASPELMAEGKLIYAVLKCWQCHGVLGRGDGPSAARLEDDWGERIRAYDFTRGDYKNGDEPTDLYRTLLTGLNGTPMPALEPSVMAFPAELTADIATVRRALDSSTVRALEAYMSDQPAAVELAKLSPDEVGQLAQRRLWSLVYYLRSLGRSKSVLYRLFAESPEPRQARKR